LLRVDYFLSPIGHWRMRPGCWPGCSTDATSGRRAQC
jgi:hypothetical protein